MTAIEILGDELAWHRERAEEESAVVRHLSSIGHPSEGPYVRACVHREAADRLEMALRRFMAYLVTASA